MSKNQKINVDKVCQLSYLVYTGRKKMKQAISDRNSRVSKIDMPIRVESEIRNLEASIELFQHQISVTKLSEDHIQIMRDEIEKKEAKIERLIRKHEERNDRIKEIMDEVRINRLKNEN